MFQSLCNLGVLRDFVWWSVRTSVLLTRFHFPNLFVFSFETAKDRFQTCASPSEIETVSNIKFSFLLFVWLLWSYRAFDTLAKALNPGESAACQNSESIDANVQLIGGESSLNIVEIEGPLLSDAHVAFRVLNDFFYYWL